MSCGFGAWNPNANGSGGPNELGMVNEDGK